MLSHVSGGATIDMGFSAVSTWLKRLAYEGFRRHTWQHPDEVIELLGIRSGATVADLGSGTGYFTFRLSEAVGPSGRVYAVDVDRGLNVYIAERARQEGRDNITAVRAESGDAMLADGSVDLIFSCNAYHHLENRVAYFRALRRCLRAGGRVAIIDARGNGWFLRWFGHWTASETIRDEMTAAGYLLRQELSTLSEQHFLIFSTST